MLQFIVFLHTVELMGTPGMFLLLNFGTGIPSTIPKPLLSITHPWDFNFSQLYLSEKDPFVLCSASGLSLHLASLCGLLPFSCLSQTPSLRLSASDFLGPGVSFSMPLSFLARTHEKRVELMTPSWLKCGLHPVSLWCPVPALCSCLRHFTYWSLPVLSL